MSLLYLEVWICEGMTKGVVFVLCLRVWVREDFTKGVEYVFTYKCGYMRIMCYT